MSRARILVVDDTPANVKLLTDVLTANGYDVISAVNGEDGLRRVSADSPDLVLLDIMMPGMNGYEVCRTIRAETATRVLPVVMVTSLDPAQERVKGLEAGADDFLSKPINSPELLARVKSLLRIKALYDEIADLNANLERRVDEQLSELQRLARLKRFFSPRVRELIISGEIDDPMKTHRREITVIFTDLRNFTAFTESAEPEEVMEVIREYHNTLGRMVVAHDATIEHFAGDGVMILLNDPVEIADHELVAIRLAVDMRDAVGRLCDTWKRRGFDLGFAVAIASGYATLGAIGFEGRRDYGAVGAVCNLAAHLCAEAKGGEVLVSQRVYGKVEDRVQADSVRQLTLKGLNRPIPTFNVISLR